MATDHLTGALRHVRQILGERPGADLTDGQLLGRFAARRDGDAFAALVRRHGPLVLRVCRRLLGDAHDAEDAFQAAFLVLARKAGSIRRRESVAGWLYEVAYHLAVQARRAAARRRTYERRAATMAVADPVARAAGLDVEAVLDEELRRLPEKYRTPLILCYLEGKTNAQAARELGWPAGSMSARLKRARQLLRERLAGRGVVLSAAGVAGLLGRGAAPAAVPAALVTSTVRSAALFAAGESAAGPLSAGAAALAEGALNAMISNKLKLLAALLLAVAVLGAGVGALVRQAAAGDGGAPAQASTAETPKAPEGDKATVADADGDPLPAGARARFGSLRLRHEGVYFLAYLDGGKSLLTLGHDRAVRVWDLATGREARRFDQPEPKGKGAEIDPPAKTGGTGVGGAAGGGVVPVSPVTLPVAALAPEGKALAWTEADGSIQVCDVATGKGLASFKPKNAPSGVFLAFAADGKGLLVLGMDRGVRLYDAATGKELREVVKPQDAGGRGLNGTGGFGGAGGPGGAAGGGAMVGWGRAEHLALSADGKTLVLAAVELDKGRQSTVVKAWDVATGKERAAFQPAAGLYLTGFGLSRDGQLLAFAATDGAVRVYDLAAGKERHQLGEGKGNRVFQAVSLLFSPDGKVLAARLGRSIRLWDVDKGKELRVLGEKPQEDPAGGVVTYPGSAGNVVTMAFAPDGKTLAVAGDGLVRLWDVAAGKEALPVAGHAGPVEAAAVSADGKVVTTLGGDNTARQWDLATGKGLRQFRPPEGATLVALSADGRAAATADADGTLRVWDVAAGKELGTVKAPAGPKGRRTAGLGAVVLSPDGKVLATRGFDRTLRAWDVASGKEVSPTPEAPKNPANGVGGGGGVMIGGTGQIGRGVADLAFSPDGRLLASVSQEFADGGLVPPGGAANGAGGGFGGPAARAKTSVRLWDLVAGRELRRFAVEDPIVAALAFSPDGKTIVGRGLDSLTLWETASGKLRARLKDVPAVQATSREGVPLAFSPDGQTLAVTDGTAAVHLWDLAAGQKLGRLDGHRASALAVAFAPDGRALVTGSADTTALAWDVAGLRKDAPKERALEAKEADALWADLAGDDAAKAYRAVQALSAAPKQAVPLLKERLKPADVVADAVIARWIADLDSESFEARQKANAELEKLGPVAEPALAKALKDNPPLETRRRVEKLLAKVYAAELTAEQLRATRAVEVLERLGSDDARQVLEGLAKGPAGAYTTREARAALDRLSRRAGRR